MSSALRLASFFLASALLAGIGCLGGESLRHEDALPPVLDCFKISTDGGPLLLPVEIQGKSYPFMLKTGASRTIYASLLRPLLGKTIQSNQMRMSDRDITVTFCQPPAAKLGHLDLPKKSPVVCMDLGKMREVSGEKISGLLGMDFLSKHVFRIDFDRGEVTFPPSAGPDAGQRLPIVFVNHLPHVMVEIPGLPARENFVVDTGMAGYVSGDLRREAFTALAKQGKLAIAGQTLTETPAGTGTEQIGRIEAISLADYRHEKLLFSKSHQNALGLNYLSRFVVTFDFPNGAIYLKKGRQYDRPDARDLSGLHILRRDGRTLVYSVAESSPAAEVGVKPQDVLLKIDDRKIDEMSLYTIRRLFCAEGKKCRLLIRRGEKEREEVIVLRDQQS
ncbi:MAG TPA: PDZ domain-containing protein [Gemmataceae bacterium]|nr:PDZ domain-containing protein [Gemmataceae bacterium]